MSHLPYDARAILAYLNELGYRNISAEQLREFMKGMQSQSDIDSKKQISAAKQPSVPTTATATATATEAATQQNRKHHRSPKIIKGKKPLIHFKFYLDICDHQLTKTIEEKISALGGCLEFFLTKNITHFVTDKTLCTNNNNNTSNNNNNNPNNTILKLSSLENPKDPVTPTSPSYSREQSPCDSVRNDGSGPPCQPSIGSGTAAKKLSRADAMLSKARRGNTTITHPGAVHDKTSSNTNISDSKLPASIATQQPYIIWSTDDALRFFKRVSQDLSKYLEKIEKKPEAEKPKSSVRPITLKGSFIKIEATKRSHRPYYQLFRKPSDWPKIELNRDDGAFRLSAKKKQPAEHSPAAGTKMTRKSRSRSTQCQAAPKEESKKPAKKTCIDNIAAKPGDANSTNAAGGGGGGGACKKVKESSEKQCGVCEICKIEYDALTIHLKTKDHEYFAKNAKNFIALDTLINASANVNNFLDANNPAAVKSGMEAEIEVAEEAPDVDSNVPDPLEGREPSTQKQQKKTVVGTSHKTPSPTLREKSKRSTKGKHSSEKFQNISIAKSSRTLSVSPQKKSSRNSSSMLDAKKSKKEAAQTPASKPGRKKPKAATTSSPIRAMLPPSSLYKVVENTSALARNCNTPPRKPLAGVAAECDTTTPAIGSPSLIVKFKKVRTTELLRLNGEAENFMFPRCRTSSELPTDLDRQTTSENAVGTSTLASSASTSADSSSDQQMDRVSIDDESNAMDATTEFATTSKATIKRGKGRPSRMQSFPIAPIQPSKFTIKKMPAAPLKACLSLPEATRKSSRTATAIVTAATKSSRLLRAAVEAAKHSKRLSYDCSRSPKGSPTTPKTLLRSLPSATKTAALKRTATVVKLEDGMGEANECDDTDQTDTDDDDDDGGDAASDDVVDSDEEEDDDADEDYVSSLRDFKVNKKLLNRSKRSCTSDRVQMKAVRGLQRSLKREVDSSEAASTANTRAKVKAKGQRKSKTKANIKSKKSLKAAKVPMKKKAIAHSGFDVSKSELLPQMRFAFERVPTTDPWYRVFVRQDAGEEHVHEYYGSTNYKKLPYELGPIPFNRTLDGISCELCGQGEAVEESSGRVAAKSSQSQGQHNQKSEALQTIAKAEEAATTTTMPKALSPMLPAQAASASSLKYTHKKLHLLQRYRREQQELLEKQRDAGQQLLKNRSRQPPETTASAVQQGRSESKASTPDREQYMARAGSTQSNTSSCASSTGTNLSTKFPRNKHLNKAAYLNLELPPRKSPREHASTLALVSCLIKQRQDSQSKPTSEVDEPPTTPTVNRVEVEEEEEEEELLRSKSVQKQPPPAELVDAALPRRPQVGTPIEELRFATEISENVKRLRRGQNKYDHSPTVVPKSMLPKRPSVRRKPLHGNALLAAKLNQRRRQPAKLDAQRGRGPLAQGKVPSIRKVGCKKGVLEFEMDEAALEALETSKQYTDVRKLEWEIDKYLQLAGKDFDIDDLPCELAANSTKTVPDDPALSNSNTPPATDYFSSDFDLCDLFSSAQNDGINQAQDHNENTKHSQTKAFSLYNTVALQNYYKKRKNLKSNRTGWPKAQKKKSSTRQREKLADKIQFLQEIGECPAAGDLLKIKEESNQADDEPDAGRDRNQQSGMMITPPDSDVDEDAELKTANDNAEYEQEADDIEMDAGGSATEEYEEDTLVDDFLDNPGADVEEDDEEGSATVGSKDRLVEEERNEDAVFYQRATKRKRRFAAASPTEKEASSSVATSCMAASTSTPCKQLLRSLRRSTPQLNGSLGSCVSPSEKAGDNSDIFTVSSDGLDTDLDQSNSRTTVLAKTGSEEQEMHGVNHTPKRKFGVVAYGKGKGVSASAKNASCAIEAASAGSRSLAISQFLTKEVKVTCRRLRTPFRRFRYRR